MGGGDHPDPLGSSGKFSTDPALDCRPLRRELARKLRERIFRGENFMKELGSNG